MNDHGYHQEDQFFEQSEASYDDPNEATPKRVVGAIVGAMVGGVIGAAIWAAIVVGTGFEIGLIALGLGGLVGAGASVGSGRARGLPYQIIAVVCVLACYAIAKLLIVVLALDVSLLNLLSPAFVFQAGFATITETLGIFDLVWVALMVSIAWRLPSNGV